MAHGARPTQLVAYKFVPPITRQEGLHPRFRQLDLQALRRDAAADFVVVGKIVRQDLKTANRRQVAAAKSQRRTQPEVDSALQQTGHKHARTKVRADAKRLQTRTQSGTRHTAVQAGHQANSRVKQRWDDAAQVVGWDTNVTVV